MIGREGETAMRRRHFLGLIAALPASAALGQQHNHHGPSYAPLRGTGPVELTPEQLRQRVQDSPAPKGAAGEWRADAPLPLPRSEMAWGVEFGGRMHVVGGYGEQRVDRAYHHVFDPADGRWRDMAPLPRGANHVAVAAAPDRIYAFGGFLEQNRKPDANAFVWDPAADKWSAVAPMSRERGAAGAVWLDGKLHVIGGAALPEKERASVGWHEVYDPQADKWEIRKALPGARDHVGIVAHAGLIHVIGGRFNTFEYNTGLHHVYDPKRDQWEARAPLPTPRSGHGLVIYKGRFFAMGGEEGEWRNGQLTGKVFGQMESYDPATDSWQSHAPMITPRHGLGAALLSDGRIHVAGGGPVVGGGVQSAIHESFAIPG